jgi:hypothetical protein
MADTFSKKELMSIPGQKRRFDRRPVTSGLPQQADIFRVRRHVSKVPQADLAKLLRESDWLR